MSRYILELKASFASSYADPQGSEVTCLCVLREKCRIASVAKFHLIFLVQLELVKKNWHEVNKIPKHHSGTLYIQPIQSDSHF